MLADWLRPGYSDFNVQGLPASGTTSPPTDYGERSIALVN
jgi:hypothetical protein